MKLKNLFYNEFKKLLFLIIGLLCVYKIANRVTGTDIGSYIEIYNDIKVYGLEYLNSRIEPLFVLLFFLSPSRIIAFGVVGAIAIYFKFKSILNLSYYPFLSLLYYLMYFFNKDELGRVRIGIAIAIIMYATIYMGEKKYLFFLLIAFLFHKSIMLYFIVFILYKKNLKLREIKIIFFSSLIFYFMDFSKLMYLLTYIPYINTTIILYLSEIKRIGFSPIMISKIFFMMIFLFYYKKLCYYKYFKKIFLIYLVGNFIYFSFNSIPIIATRGSEIFTCVEFILLPYLLKISNRLYVKTYTFFIMTSYYLYISRFYLFDI